MHQCLFIVGCALVMLMQQADLLPSSTQRIVAMTLLHELYRGEPFNNNPFSAIFVHLLVNFCTLIDEISLYLK